MFSFVCALIIILAAAYWAFQGVFSAVIMFGESLIALMIAFTLYEPLANSFKETLDPQLGEAAFLIIVFFVTLILLRYLTDKTIPGNMRVHVAVDRAGGGIFGFLTGMVCVGMVLIGAQMLPLGRTTLGFERNTPRSDGTMHRNTFAWFNPDGF